MLIIIIIVLSASFRRGRWILTATAGGAPAEVQHRACTVLVILLICYLLGLFR